MSQNSPKIIVVQPKEIENTYRKYYLTHRGNKQHYFALLWMKQAFNITDEEAIEHIEFAVTNTTGIDAYYFRQGPQSSLLVAIQKV